MLHQQSDGNVGTEQGGTSSTSWCRTPGWSLLAPGALAAQQAGGGCRTRSVPGIWQADAAASAGFIIAHKSGLLQPDRGHPAGSENPNGLVFLSVFARGLVAAARGSPPATPRHPPETPSSSRAAGRCRSPLVPHQEEETLLPGRKGPAGALGARCLPLVSAHPTGGWLWRAEDTRGD